MLSNQSITIRRHGTDSMLSMLTWPAGASIPKVGEHIVYYTANNGRQVGLVKRVEHEHVLRDNEKSNEVTAEINISIWVELE